METDKRQSLLAVQPDEEVFPFDHLLYTPKHTGLRHRREPQHVSGVRGCLRRWRNGVLTSDWLYLTLLGLSMGVF
ncbi:unnamed protein product, partial [Soboliphyme baturini]|uniref:SLC3A2_N domain-containing protein n=1 Tax=Soboliphyme baturini TaxID=241478 RepID=A0A183JAD8_9BILA